MLEAGVATLAVIALTVIAIVTAYPLWVTVLIALAIVAVALMFGVRGGFAAALIATAGSVGWDLADGFQSHDLLNYRNFSFFAFGLVTGYFAHGVLGDYHVGREIARGRLRRAIHRGEIILHYQPVAEAESGKVVSFEALVRWQHPEKGTLLPADFVPLAEGDRATIWELTLHTLSAAIAECGRWQRGGCDVGVSVNLSPATIDNDELAEQIGEMLDLASLSPNRLTLEVTESAVMDDPATVAQVLGRVRALNTAAIAIDDFGTGYSSLARLEQLPIDTLKIDRLFMAHASEEHRREMLQSIIDLAHGLSLTACAEGVEDHATWDALIDLGCDTVQGYALGHPMPAGDVTAWFQSSAAEAARPPAAGAASGSRLG
jgi:EAL domain-containing protein (putative c-di-GMP-specific phosphodiesterase class I)